MKLYVWHCARFSLASWFCLKCFLLAVVKKKLTSIDWFCFDSLVMSLSGSLINLSQVLSVIPLYRIIWMHVFYIVYQQYWGCSYCQYVLVIFFCIFSLFKVPCRCFMLFSRLRLYLFSFSLSSIDSMRYLMNL